MTVRSATRRRSRAQYETGIPPDLIEPIGAELALCRHDLSRFNSTILGRPAYWHRQREICDAVLKYRNVCVPTGNGVGKSYLIAGLALALCLTHPGSITIVAAPTASQLTAVSWANLVNAVRWAEDPRRGLGYPLGGRFRGLTYEIDPDWRIEGWASGSVEAKSGRHTRDMFVLYDEASGIAPSVIEAGDSLNAAKYIYFGNPLRPEQRFYEVAKSDNPNTKVIRISSLESPDIHMQRSERGMADAGWLEDVRWEYGEDSLWWKSHVLGEFPDEMEQTLLPIAWLDAAAKLEHAPSVTPRRIGVDLAKGNEGDLSLIVVRDDRGIIEAEWSSKWTLETTAKKVKHYSDKHHVPGKRVTFDATGLGTDFANRLAAESPNLAGAMDYMGSRSGGEKFANLRSAAGWAFRRRLDPNRTRTIDEAGTRAPQPPFSMPAHLRKTFSRELQGMRYALDDAGRIALEPKEELQARIKQSPNFVDACLMTFAYPHA